MATITDQVRYETQVRFRYGAVAFVAALTLIGSQLLQLAGPHASVNELTVDLIAANQRLGLDLVGSALDLVGLIALAITLNWLHNVTHYRRPEIKSVIRWVAVTGAILTGVMSVAYTLVIGLKANQFVTEPLLSYPEAHKLTSGGLATIVPLLFDLGTFLLALGIIWVSLNALRAGLVTRLVGYAGVFAGALFIFPIGTLVPIVQGYWLGALAVILAARWPSGDPPAWESGEARPWTDARGSESQQRKRERGQGGAARKPKPERVSMLSIIRGGGVPAPPPEDEPPKPVPAPKAGARKRKRKRRS